MLLGIIICGVIIALALYDYFSTRNWQVVTSEKRNEAVFEKRNKAYGAYQIRTNYDKRLLLILLGLTIGVGGLYGASLTIKHRVHKKQGHTVDVGQLLADNDKPDEQPEDKKPVDKPVEQTQAQTYKFIAPTITDLKNVADTMSIPDPNKGQVGVQDLKGKNPFDEPPITTTAIIGDSKKKDSLDVNGVGRVDEVAYFKGGREAMIKYLTKAIDPNVQGNGTCKLKFIVSADGSISQVWVKQKVTDCPECDKEAEKAVLNMPPWEPGKLNGTPVKSYFYLPISFR